MIRHSHKERICPAIVTKYIFARQSYKCPKCDKCFTQKIHLSNHIAHLHCEGPRKSYKCPKCDKSYLYERHVYRHYSRIHCGEQLEKKSEYYNYKCQKCDNKYLSRKELNHHYRNVHFVSATSLSQKGYLPHHSATLQPSPKGTSFKCDKCDRSYSDYTYLQHHVTVMHSVVPRTKGQCNICGAKVLCLRDHLKRHTMYKKIKCQICGVKVLHIKAHLKIHTH